ncbi:MAG: response regulator [Nitrospirae bacterium]|nr:response regulator [Nitrospirota bacterium]
MSDTSIIVIDDDKNNSQQISEILRQEGYTVYNTTTKAESVAQVKKGAPGLVFVKSMLMDASGYEIIRDIRSTHPDIPFIMLTEIDKKYDDRYRTIYKIVDTVKIPVERDELLAKTRAHIVYADEPLSETASFDFDKTDLIAEKEPQKPEPPKYEREQEDEQDNKQEELADTLGYGKHKSDRGGLFELEEVELQKDPDMEEFDQDTEILDEVPMEDYPKAEEKPEFANLRKRASSSDFEEEIKRQKKPYTEDITTIEPDEEEFIRSLKEKNDKRKKIIVGLAAAVFLVVLSVVYLFGVKGKSTKTSKSLIAQKGKPAVMSPVVKVSPPPTPLPTVPSAVVEPTPLPLKQVSPEPPQHITPEYVKPEEVKPDKNELTAKAQRPQHKEKPAKKSPKPHNVPVEKAAKSSEEAVDAKGSKAHKEVRAAKEVKPAKAVKLAKKEERETPVAPEKSSKEAFSIQLGSFEDPANAKRLTESLKKDGFNAFVKEYPGQSGRNVTTHKVFVGRYENKTDALKTMKKLRDSRKVDVILRKI